MVFWFPDLEDHCQVKGHWTKEEEFCGCCHGRWCRCGSPDVMPCVPESIQPGVSWTRITLAAWSRRFLPWRGPWHGATGSCWCRNLDDVLLQYIQFVMITIHLIFTLLCAYCNCFRSLCCDKSSGQEEWFVFCYFDLYLYRSVGIVHIRNCLLYWYGLRPLHILLLYL